MEPRRVAGKLYYTVTGTKTRLKYRAIGLAKKRSRTIMFCPEKPEYTQVLSKMCRTSGWTMTSSIHPQPDLIVAFEYATKTGLVIADPAGKPVVNQRCTDISKVKVERVFREVFGYGTFVDPAGHHGMLVAKSDENAMHDGEVILCPASAQPGVVYQRLINNTVGNEVLDIRVPIIGGRIPFVYLKYRSVKSRFSNKNTRVVLRKPDAVLSGDETAKIIRFADRMGLDFGELDVLRDSDDGCVYIVDVNNTPCGPPNGLGRADGARAIRCLSGSFDSVFFG